MVEYAGAAEQQNQREADDEWRRDDWQNRHRAEQFLEAEIRARDHERECKSKCGRAGAADQREQQSVPGDAATRTTGEAAEPPHLLLRETPEERHDRQRAAV